MHTVVETVQFIKACEGILSEPEKNKLFEEIARTPDKGEVIPGTGGVRKLRFAIKGKGKRSGARVVYYYYNEDNPVFLFNIYEKGQRIDLTPDEKKYLYNVIQKMKKNMKKGGKKK